MRLVLHSMTYHECPVQVRERVAFTPEQRRFMLRKMHAEDAVSEAMILETCNRLEFYLYARKDFDCEGFLVRTIAQVSPDAALTWRSFNCMTSGRDVIRHLFEVAAGLDSQMVGENQILAQVKSAYTESLNCRMSKLIFHRLLHSAFRVGKAVRARTNINCGAVSIGLAAVELARSRLDVSTATAMVIGAGENAELIATYLVKADLTRLIIANRNVDKAAALASRFDSAEAVALSDISRLMPQVDLVIASTSAEEPLITCEILEDHLESRDRSLLMIDIAVPRDIDPALAQFDCVRLYNIDDLNTQIDANRQMRSSEIPKAREIIDEFAAKFTKWYESLDLVPVISDLTQKGLSLAQSEAARYARNFGEENNDKLREFAESLVRKVLHGPISFIRSGDENELSTEQIKAIDLINKMFLSEDRP